MKHAREVGANQIGFLAGNLERISCMRQRLSSAVTAPLLVIIAVGVGRMLHASEATAAGQWNIMVVPANQTAFSGQARELFDAHCASCHSKDGRAQTPVARQRGVRDLSESTLTDEEIIEQILLGTHGKEVDFRMPSFRERLGRTSIEELVPVVKAFRPVLPHQEHPVAASPRLAGIVNFPNRKVAVLEKVAHSGQYFLLGVNENHAGIELAGIRPAQGTVQLRVRGTNSPLTLKLDRELIQAGGAKAPGFLRRIFDSWPDNRHALALDQANMDLVLFLYSQFTGRTVLRSPRLPATSFSLNATGSDQRQIARCLEKALTESGVATVPDGSKFVLVVLASEVSTINPRSSQIVSMEGDSNRSALFRGGAFINFSDAEMSEVVKFDVGLTGRSLDQTQPLPSNRIVKFTSQSALTKEECTYALETVIGLQGVQLVPVGNRLARPVPIPDNGK